MSRPEPKPPSTPVSSFGPLRRNSIPFSCSVNCSNTGLTSRLFNFQPNDSPFDFAQDCARSTSPVPLALVHQPGAVVAAFAATLVLQRDGPASLLSKVAPCHLVHEAIIRLHFLSRHSEPSATPPPKKHSPPVYTVISEVSRWPPPRGQTTYAPPGAAGAGKKENSVKK